MKSTLLSLCAVSMACVAVACGGSSKAKNSSGHVITGAGGGTEGVGGTQSGSGVSAGGSTGGSDPVGSGGKGGSGPPPVSAIKHVVIIVQENHSFETYFGGYCQAAPGSEPTCTNGPSCCEGAPATDPNGYAPTVLDDFENGDYDPSHVQACELSEFDNGAMDGFTAGQSCSDVRNFAIAPASVVQTYYDYATNYALADRYFQPIAGQSSSNDMYLAVAHYVFTDNDEKPDTNGSGCDIPGPSTIYHGKPTIADALIDGGHSFAFYPEGYDAMIAATFCPSAPSDCPWGFPTTPCVYDPADDPFQFYAQFADNMKYQKDLKHFRKGIVTGDIPDVSFIKGVGYHNEHPGYSTTISQGVTFVDDIVNSILTSPIANDTLILITWDEGGGFFDHVSPPSPNAVDLEPYGMRVPLIAIGPFAKTNHVSHVMMEHSSIVKFLEYNFLGQTGQLGARDTVVANIGSMLDSSKTGIVVPEN